MRRGKILLLVTLSWTLFLSGAVASAQAMLSKPIPRDWQILDPITDSIVGISLNKSYDLLKTRTAVNVIVAVIDNGVDINHEDLKEVIWTNVDEIPSNNLDDDNNGYVDDVHGWNFRGAKDGRVIENEWSSSLQFYMAWKSKHEAKPGRDDKFIQTFKRAERECLKKFNSDDSSEILFAFNEHYHSSALINNDNGTHKKNYGSPLAMLSKNLSHGTHVAGIIAAGRGNGIGTDGIANHVSIMPLLATTAVGDERDKDIANAIYYAVDNGARIINMSFSKLFSPEKDLVDAAIRYAEEKDVLVVHAAGNDGVDSDSAINYHYPIASYEDGSRANNFISVGWSRALFDYRLAHPRSVYGRVSVDLFAPGSDIYSTGPGNEYASKSGSSMSTPIVTGVAAILRSYFPALTATQVREILLKSAFRPSQIVDRPGTKEKVAFTELSVSGGIVNAFNAVRLALSEYDK